MTSGQDHYQTLQVSRTAEQAVVRASYKALIQKYHPDRYQPLAEAEAMTRQLNAAYAVLSNVELRAEYDRRQWPSSGFDHSTPPPTPPPVPPEPVVPSGPPKASRSKQAGCLWVLAIAAGALIGGKVGAIVFGPLIGGLVGAVLGASPVLLFDYFWTKFSSLRARLVLVGATALLGSLAAIVAALALFIQSPTPSHTAQTSAAQESSWAPVTQVPSTSFVAKDQFLAQKLGVTLPQEIGVPADPQVVWETRQRMFLSLPENAHLNATAAAISAWGKGMQEATDDAAAVGYELDDYQVMEAGRVRVR